MQGVMQESRLDMKNKLGFRLIIVGFVNNADCIAIPALNISKIKGHGQMCIQEELVQQ